MKVFGEKGMGTDANKNPHYHLLKKSVLCHDPRTLGACAEVLPLAPTPSLAFSLPDQQWDRENRGAELQGTHLSSSARKVLENYLWGLELTTG